MKKITVAVIIGLFMATVFISDTALAAWTQAKGHAYNQLTAGLYVTTKKYTTIGSNFDNIARRTGGEDIRVVKTARFASESLTYYGEYGITDTLTVFTAIPYKRSESDDTIRYAGERGPSGIGDIDLGLRYNLMQNFAGTGALMSVQGGVKIPKAYKYGNPLLSLSLGDGQYDANAVLQFGRGIGKGWVLFQGGYKYRFENTEFNSFKPSDQVITSLTAAYGIIPLIEMRGRLSWNKSVGNARVSQEMIRENFAYGGYRQSQDNVLIRDSLGLEPSNLGAGVDMAINFMSKWQTVLSYDTDLKGFAPFETRDWALGETFSFALVYMY